MTFIHLLKNEHIGYLSAIIAAILFGSVSTITKPVLEDLNALSVSSLTYIIAGLSLIPFMKFSATNSSSSTLESTNPSNTSKWTNNNKSYFLLLLTSLCGAVIAPSLFFYGLSNSSASDSSILISGEVLFSILLAIVFFNEKLIKREILAMILVLIGIVILTTNMQFFSSNSFLELNIGNILVVGSALFWALDNNISRILSKTIHIPKIIVLKTLIGGSLLFIITIIVFGLAEFDIDIIHVSYLVFAGSMGIGGSLFFFLHGLKRIGTVKTILLFSTSSIFGIIFAKVFLNENITIYQVIAVGVILSGCYLIKR
ncbi:MAG TPA: DMT family transporter [Nitrososphaeraceae archaeon]|nr:DMT family transporter [Nitrososphaeraceae archaeon]